MNWLAHVYLSEPDTECRLGNLLADVVKGKDRHGLSAGFLRGVACHQAIDAFTDYHPVVGRSRARIRSDYGRCAGVLVDVFYDHFLARHWDRYCAVPLADFTAELYAAIDPPPLALPESARGVVSRIVAEDRLGSYRRLDGIEAALRGISARLTQRLHRPFALEKSVRELTGHYRELEDDFAAFFPALCAHVRQWCEK